MAEPRFLFDSPPFISPPENVCTITKRRKIKRKVDHSQKAYHSESLELASII
jgi:hypothetical protein